MKTTALVRRQRFVLGVHPSSSSPDPPRVLRCHEQCQKKTSVRARRCARAKRLHSSRQVSRTCGASASGTNGMISSAPWTVLCEPVHEILIEADALALRGSLEIVVKAVCGRRSRKRDASPCSLGTGTERPSSSAAAIQARIASRNISPLRPSSLSLSDAAGELLNHADIAAMRVRRDAQRVWQIEILLHRARRLCLTRPSPSSPSSGCSRSTDFGLPSSFPRGRSRRCGRPVSASFVAAPLLSENGRRCRPNKDCLTAVLATAVAPCAIMHRRIINYEAANSYPSTSAVSRSWRALSMRWERSGRPRVLARDNRSHCGLGSRQPAPRHGAACAHPVMAWPWSSCTAGIFRHAAKHPPATIAEESEAFEQGVADEVMHGAGG